jgi:dTDP-4-amino-4,6-dideoxygalactose transaminase
VLEGGWYILGQEVAAFEAEFARYLGVGQAVGVGSGTEALHLALRVCGVGPGDAVATVLVDIDPKTFTLDPSRLEDALKAQGPGGRVKAVIPVHLYGHPADMPAILEVASRHGAVVIEDCAQSHGATLKGRKTGSWGHLAAFSFYPTKNLGAVGDGGALVTSDPELAGRARLLREYGWRERYLSELPGLNSRLDELQAAVLRVKLRALDRENGRRRELACIYDARLSATPLGLPRVRGPVEHVYHLYVVRSRWREELQAFLKANGVGTAIHYPAPVHLQPAYRRRLALRDGQLRQTELVCREVLSLPLYPQLTDAQVEYASERIVTWHR